MLVGEQQPLPYSRAEAHNGHTMPCCALRLAFAYILLLWGALGSVALVVRRSRFFLIPAQRSIVVAVTPPCLLVFFADPAVLAARILRLDVGV